MTEAPKPPKGRPGAALPRVPPNLVAEGAPARTLASLLVGAGAPTQMSVGEDSAPPPHEILAASTQPSEMENPSVEPVPGPGQEAPMGRTGLHTPSEAAMAVGYGGPSADAPQGPTAAEPRFVRKSMGQRVPFGVREQKMAWPPIPGFHTHWFNNEPGRIGRAQAAGYEMVTGENGRPVTTVVGTDRSGKPLSAFLMKIRQEWYDEDMMAIEHEQRAILGAIRQGRTPAPSTNPRDQGTQYVPAQGIRVQDGTGARR